MMKIDRDRYETFHVVGQFLDIFSSFHIRIFNNCSLVCGMKVKYAEFSFRGFTNLWGLNVNICFDVVCRCSGISSQDHRSQSISHRQSCSSLSFLLSSLHVISAMQDSEIHSEALHEVPNPRIVLFIILMYVYHVRWCRGKVVN